MAKTLRMNKNKGSKARFRIGGDWGTRDDAIFQSGHEIWSLLKISVSGWPMGGRIRAY
jgi:hypothetical protein